MPTRKCEFPPDMSDLGDFYENGRFYMVCVCYVIQGIFRVNLYYGRRESRALSTREGEAPTLIPGRFAGPPCSIYCSISRIFCHIGV